MNPAGQVKPNQIGGARRPAVARRNTRLIHDQRPDERIVCLLHRHPVVLLRSLALPIVLVATWVFGILLVEPFLSALSVDPLVAGNAPPAWLVPALWTFWLGIGGLLLAWIAYAIFDWREDWLALTTQRVIVMNKMLFLRESRSEAPIGKVQNVVAEYPNALGKALDFGDIKVDTAGVGTLHFKSLRRPRALREAIFGQQKAAQSLQPKLEDPRKSAVRAIVLGSAPAADGGRSTVDDRAAQVGARRAVRIWHKHWAYLLRALIWPFVLVGGVLAGWLLSVVLGEPGVVGPVESVLSWVLLLLLPVCAAWVIWCWEDWRNDLYKLDHERLYHIESLPFGLREQSKETLINRITDVTYVIPGPLANLFDYGSVVIKTPGEATEFVFAGIPHPRSVQQEIMGRVDDSRRKAGGPNPEMEAWIRAYHEVVQGN